MKRDIVETLKALSESEIGLEATYSHFREPKEPPFIVYLGSGQNKLEADDTRYWHENTYQVEYYFKVKDEAKEEAIEQALLDGGFLFEKSEDTYIDDEDVFVIYYYTN